MSKQHHYTIRNSWTGNLGTGTSGYRAYSRNHIISAENKAAVLSSSDPAFRGDATRYNPEEMLVASLSSCHMLWFLHLCAEAGVVVISYADKASGIMEETADGGGRFVSVSLSPEVVVASEEMIEKVAALHHKAHELCFIANSVNFPVNIEPVTKS